MVVRDQMVGPFQVPVGDVGITATSLKVGMNTGEAMAMGGTKTLLFFTLDSVSCAVS